MDPPPPSPPDLRASHDEATAPSDGGILTRERHVVLSKRDRSQVTDPNQFALGVRDAMAAAMRVPTTEHSWADMYLNMKAQELGKCDLLS